MRKNWLIAIIFGASLALAAPAAFAQGEGHGNGHGRDKNHRGDDNAQGNEDHGRWGPRFSHDDQVIIEAYFRRGRGHGDGRGEGEREGERGLPPGLAKRGGNLPPGLEKQLRERGTLPPGLQKRCEPLPYDLDRRLPRLPYGYRRVVIGTDILIVNRNWGISAIIRGVIP